MTNLRRTCEYNQNVLVIGQLTLALTNVPTMKSGGMWAWIIEIQPEVERPQYL